MSFDLRRCDDADADALALIGRASFLETYAGEIDGRNIIAYCAEKHAPDYYRAWMGEPDAALWLATRFHAPIGYAGLSAPDLPVEIRDGDVELRRIYVLTPFHRDGVGAALMRAALEEAGARGAKRVLLGVKKTNARALAFYGRQGFAQIGERRFLVGADAYEDWVLARAP